MRVLDGLNPREVFYYFEEICRIPHGSGNIWQISNYLVDFAKERKLEHYQDRVGNVIIIKEATKGYESHPPVMLQGHMDMVAVKKPDYPIDMKKEGLIVKVDGDKVYAEGTSLGGDDGIAVAYGLAILDSNTCKHPRIELVVTVDEEVGMDGAREIDLSPCKAVTLINIDSEEEGIFLAGCAGGARINYSHDYQEESKQGVRYQIKVSGLVGGHSGAEIHKERGNANCLLARILKELSSQMDIQVAMLEGGLADNAIPREGLAEIVIESRNEGACTARIQDLCKKLHEELKTELSEKDPDICIEVKQITKAEENCMTLSDSKKLIAFLNAIPNGVQAMSSAMEGLVETSLNLGILSYLEGKLQVSISVRSSYESAKKALIQRLDSLAVLAGMNMEVSGDYPGWAYKKNSPLREKMVAVYEEMFGKTPEIQAIHAGLECGLLAHKIPGLDCVSIGPDMKNIHTTEEELSISSTERVYCFLLKLLEEL